MGLWALTGCTPVTLDCFSTTSQQPEEAHYIGGVKNGGMASLASPAGQVVFCNTH